MGDGSSDQELIVRATKGDRHSLGLLLLGHYDRLVRRVEPKLTGPLARTLGVDDIIQEVFIRAIRDIELCEARTETSFVAWLNSLCDYEFLDCIKRHRRKKRGGEFRQFDAEGATSSVLDLFDLLMGDSHTPDRSIARREAISAIQVGIAALPEDQRDAIRLHCICGQSLEETATEMQRSPGAVRGLVQRGKAALRITLVRSTLWLSKK